MIDWLVGTGAPLPNGPKGAVQVTVEDNGYASVGVQEDEGVGKRNEPGSDEALGGLALLRVVIDDECLPLLLAIWCAGLTEGT